MNCIDIISRALRRIGVVAGGELPTDIEAQDALETLKSIYARLLTEGAFGEITSTIPASAYTAGENERVIISTLAVTDVELPETITECGRERPVRDGAIIVIANHLTNQTTTYVRDGQANVWCDMDNLDLTSAAPLSRRDAIGLSSYLALELCDEYRQQPSEITIRNAARFTMGITHNWSEPQTIGRGVYF
ncbi:hypothetical protein C8J25_107276 [Sphingomonas faeni]|uniref:Uncharacterized protein n=1 Tax=Sphingomonas faeni TaxID=185950 RepID=A0A2T5U267_9SPHN|nr:hypothetical protein [Sphingomonas faeni]PTW45591.1 hypothetical protein C8J25_107276 [Sphingomonas faeni]